MRIRTIGLATQRLCSIIMMSDACGYHCVFYSVYRCLGFDGHAIINIYSTNTLYNNLIVKEVKRHKVMV